MFRGRGEGQIDLSTSISPYKEKVCEEGNKSEANVMIFISSRKEPGTQKHAPPAPPPGPHLRLARSPARIPEAAGSLTAGPRVWSSLGWAFRSISKEHTVTNYLISTPRVLVMVSCSIKNIHMQYKTFCSFLKKFWFID